jgi:predicted DNA-binding transcriptional regulator AlpA
VADGTIPPPIKLGGASRWPLSDIVGVIEKAKAARGGVANRSSH